jgi:hypothetical protein
MYERSNNDDDGRQTERFETGKPASRNAVRTDAERDQTEGQSVRNASRSRVTPRCGE